MTQVRAPFPAFGGKSRVADEVWRRMGDVRNFVEPFCYSSAVLLRRPTPGAIETINDRNAYVANFWRAVRADPEAVAAHADWPVNETDLHARHRWLVGSERAAAALESVREDPEAFDARIAGWWCWGACCWIGSGWCDETHRNAAGKQRAYLTGDGRGNGVVRTPLDQSRLVASPNPRGEQIPMLAGDAGAHGRGVNASAGPNRMHKFRNRGVCAGPDERRPKMSGGGNGNCGVHAGLPHKWAKLNMACGVHGDAPERSRPQLADPSRGLDTQDAPGTCEARRAWITDWMLRLADRLRPVRVCCGHWSRVCDSPSTMTRLGTTGVFLDPPYRKQLADGTKNRSAHIYANDRVQDVDALCDEVQAWCLKWGEDPMVRVALCGLEGEYPVLEAAGWEVHAWKSNGGYGNRRGGNINAARERVWFSPHCLRPSSHTPLFDEI